MTNLAANRFLVNRVRRSGSILGATEEEGASMESQQAQRAPRVESVPRMPENSAPLRVLVVDDELLIRWSISETLQHDGHVVAEAGSAAQAMEQIALATPDVVLLDYWLPDSNDLSLLAAIRRRSPRSAVVMMTAHGEQSMASAAIELGAFRVLSKPMDMLDVGRVVREAFESVH